MRWPSVLEVLGSDPDQGALICGVQPCKGCGNYRSIIGSTVSDATVYMYVAGSGQLSRVFPASN